MSPAALYASAARSSRDAAARWSGVHWKALVFSRAAPSAASDRASSSRFARPWSSLRRKDVALRVLGAAPEAAEVAGAEVMGVTETAAEGLPPNSALFFSARDM